MPINKLIFHASHQGVLSCYWWELCLLNLFELYLHRKEKNERKKAFTKKSTTKVKLSSFPYCEKSSTANERLFTTNERQPSCVQLVQATWFAEKKNTATISGEPTIVGCSRQILCMYFDVYDSFDGSLRVAKQRELQHSSNETQRRSFNGKI